MKTFHDIDELTFSIELLKTFLILIHTKLVKIVENKLLI